MVGVSATGTMGTDGIAATQLFTAGAASYLIASSVSSALFFLLLLGLPLLLLCPCLPRLLLCQLESRMRLLHSKVQKAVVMMMKVDGFGRATLARRARADKTTGSRKRAKGAPITSTDTLSQDPKKSGLEVRSPQGISEFFSNNLHVCRSLRLSQR